MPDRITDSSGAGPLLDAVEAARGSIVDIDSGVVVNPDELKRTIPKLERLFQQGGLSRGERVVMAVGNGPLFFGGLAAVLSAGGSPILLHGDSPAAEVARTAKRFGADYALVDSLTEADMEGVGFAARPFASARWASAVWARTSSAVERTGGGDTLEGVPLHPTSGTTGESKLAARPGGAAVAEAQHYIDTIGIDQGDTILCHIPMSHAYGYGMCFMVPLLSGARLLTMRRLNASSLVATLDEQRVTVYPSVPAALDFLTTIEASVLPSCITTAGAPLPERLARRFNERWNTTIRPLYGTTETGGISVAAPEHDPGMISSVGPPMAGVELRLEPLPDSQPGGDAVRQLWVKSDSMMAGYVSPSGVDGSLVDGGWFNTGDMASIDSEGNILLRGRVSETINMFGNKVLPLEVEEVIAMLSEVLEVKVYSAPNRWGSNWVKAAVVAKSGLTAEDVRAHCRLHLVDYKQPMLIEMLDRLPRTASGKVIVSELP